MTPEARKIKEILECKDVLINRDELDRIIKDRLDFGFDSIYFRFAEVCDELAIYKSRVDHSDPIEEKRRMNGRKQHFYMTLKQLVHAHDQEEE